MRDLLPHAAPYLLYVAIGAAASGVCPYADAVRFAACGAILVWGLRAGWYPELRAKPRAAHLLVGVAAGTAIGLAWVPLAKLVPTIGDPARTGLDPAKSVVESSLRIVDMVILAPFVEELFIRSLVPRFADARDDRDWRAIGIGEMTKVGALVSLALFTFTHPEWLAALVTGVVWTAMLRAQRNLWPVIVSHAVANAWLARHVLVTGEKQWW